jgi:hypothetical protein
MTLKIIEKRRLERAEKEIATAIAEEQERRKWCVEQAVMIDETGRLTVLGIAEELYKYVWGARDDTE